MKPLAILLGFGHVAGSAVAAFLLLFIATFPFENTDNSGWIWPFILVGLALLVLALISLVGVVRGRPWSFVSFGLHLLIGLAFVYWAVGESTHSDDKLLLFAAAVEFCGLFAALLSVEPR